MKRTNILYVLDNERFGGGERALAQLMNGLDRSRFGVFAACLTGTPGSKPFVGAVSSSARVEHFDLRRLVSFSAAPALRRIVRGNAIDVVHSHGPRADFYARLAVRGLKDIRLVSTVATPVEEYDIGPLRKLLYAGFDRLYSSSVDRYVAVAAHIKRKLMERRGIAPSRIEVIYNGAAPAGPGLLPSEISAGRSRLGVPPGCPLASVFCRFVPEKGLFVLAAAASLIAGRGKEVKYLLAGTGPLELGLKERVRELGLEKYFIFPGFVLNVAPLMAVSDMVIIPSFREGFPMTLLEAMSAGKPVIASDIEGIDEAIVDGETGILVPPGDPEALAGAIERLSLSPAEAVGMGNEAKSAVKRFSFSATVSAHERLYSELAEK